MTVATDTTLTGPISEVRFEVDGLANGVTARVRDVYNVAGSPITYPYTVNVKCDNPQEPNTALRTFSYQIEENGKVIKEGKL